MARMLFCLYWPYTLIQIIVGKPLIFIFKNIYKYFHNFVISEREGEILTFGLPRNEWSFICHYHYLHRWWIFFFSVCQKFHNHLLLHVRTIFNFRFAATPHCILHTDILILHYIYINKRYNKYEYTFFGFKFVTLVKEQKAATQQLSTIYITMYYIGIHTKNMWVPKRNTLLLVLLFCLCMFTGLRMHWYVYSLLNRLRKSIVLLLVSADRVFPIRFVSRIRISTLTCLVCCWAYSVSCTMQNCLYDIRAVNAWLIYCIDYII